MKWNRINESWSDMNDNERARFCKTILNKAEAEITDIVESQPGVIEVSGHECSIMNGHETFQVMVEDDYDGEKIIKNSMRLIKKLPGYGDDFLVKFDNDPTESHYGDDWDTRLLMMIHDPSINIDVRPSNEPDDTHFSDDEIEDFKALGLQCEISDDNQEIYLTTKNGTLKLTKPEFGGGYFIISGKNKWGEDNKAWEKDFDDVVKWLDYFDYM